MKNTYSKYVLFGLIALTFFSCEEDFLQENPVANLSTQTFFVNEKDFRQATNAIYANLQILSGGGAGGLGVGGYWAMSEMRSDNSTYQYNTVDLSGHYSWYLDNFI